jgi:hypothetical protein
MSDSKDLRDRRDHIEVGFTTTHVITASETPLNL